MAGDICTRPATTESLSCKLIEVLTLTYQTFYQAKSLRKIDPVANRSVYAENERQDWSLKGVLHRTLYRPFYMLAKEPILVMVTAFLSLANGVLYAREYLHVE
jgi:hypothetical protein